MTQALGGAVMIVALALGADLEAQARTPPTAPRFTGTSFVLVHYDAGASLAVYGAKRLGPGMALVGIVGNPGTAYRAIIVGGGTRLRLGAHAGVTAFLAGQDASSGASLRMYVLPEAAIGRVTVSATGALRQPFDGGGRREASVDPVTVALRISDVLKVGVAGVVSVAERHAVDWGVGPSVAARVLGGFVSLEIVVRARGEHPELRGEFSAAL
ncbi:MAG TPA: hypothetical protein VJ992_12845 [Gemmatimonadales bacterium]|nr:hypothetical protein [Gemmatimonadales bacterium]